jgi:hypothetical protein
MLTTKRIKIICRLSWAILMEMINPTKNIMTHEFGYEVVKIISWSASEDLSKISTALTETNSLDLDSEETDHQYYLTSWYFYLLLVFLQIILLNMTSNNDNLPKRIVRTITLTEDDLFLLDGIERILSKTGQRVKTDSKLIRTAIQVAHQSLNGKTYDIKQIAEKVVQEDGRSLSKLLPKSKKG